MIPRLKEVITHPRVNIFDAPTGVGVDTPTWSDAHARENVDVIAYTLAPRVLVTLGQRVAHAFGVSPDIHYVTHRLPLAIGDDTLSCDVIVAPHPSGRSAKLNNALDRREFRRALLVDLVHAAPRLTPLDFALTPSAARMRADVIAAREILADLAHVVCPTDPRAGACALRWAVTAGITEQSVRALAEWFTRYNLTPLEALRGLITDKADRRAWGLSNRQDTPGDDLSRAVVLEQALQRLEGRAEAQLDLRREARFGPVAASDGGPLLAHVTGHEPPVRGERRRHRERHGRVHRRRHRHPHHHVHRLTRGAPCATTP